MRFSVARISTTDPPILAYPGGSPRTQVVWPSFHHNPTPPTFELGQLMPLELECTTSDLLLLIIRRMPPLSIHHQTVQHILPVPGTIAEQGGIVRKQQMRDIKPTLRQSPSWHPHFCARSQSTSLLKICERRCRFDLLNLKACWMCFRRLIIQSTNIHFIRTALPPKGNIPYSHVTSMHSQFQGIEYFHCAVTVHPF